MSWFSELGCARSPPDASVTLGRTAALRQKRSSGLPIYFINSIPIGRRIQLGAELYMKVHLYFNCQKAARRSLLRKRMPEEKTQHFPRCVRSPRIRVGARRTAARPRMGGTVDTPVL
jgi:hypothetical protein